MLFEFKSTLLNIIPVFGEAGLIFKLTLDPVWIPMPLKEMDFDNVFWVSIDTWNLYKMWRKLNTQEILQENTIIYRKSWKIFQKFHIFY